MTRDDRSNIGLQRITNSEVYALLEKNNALCAETHPLLARTNPEATGTGYRKWRDADLASQCAAFYRTPDWSKTKDEKSIVTETKVDPVSESERFGF